MYQSIASFGLLILIVTATLPAQAIPTPAPPKIAASGHLLIDFASGYVLAEENANQRLEPASLTKLMTAHVVFTELAQGNLRLGDEVTVSEKAWKTPGSRMFIEVGKKIKVEDLIMGMIIQSGNDACVALAEHIAGSESVFASVMNAHAKKLGMLNTNFVNATGLPEPDHYTTAEDIAKVGIATIRDFPEYYKWYSEKSFKFNNITQQNRNKLLWKDVAVDGLKTGHTESAGYCLVASAKKENMRLLSVVMGADSEKQRADESLKLLNYGFRFFETHKLYAAGDVLNRAKIWKGSSSELPVGLRQDLYITIPRNQYKNLNAAIHLNSPIIAPINKAQQVGEIDISLSGNPVARKPLVALQEVGEAGFVSRMLDNVLMMLE